MEREALRMLCAGAEAGAGQVSWCARAMRGRSIIIDKTCLAKERQARADDIAGVRAGADAGPAVVLRLRTS